MPLDFFGSKLSDLLGEDMELKSLALAYHQGPDLRASKGMNKIPSRCLDLSQEKDMLYFEWRIHEYMTTMICILDGIITICLCSENFKVDS